MNRTVIRVAVTLACLAAVGVSLTFVRTATSDDPVADLPTADSILGEPPAVGTYQIAAAGTGDSTHVYKLDTRTGQLWECGGLVWTLEPMQAGSGCLEIPREFKPTQKQQ